MSAAGPDPEQAKGLGLDAADGVGAAHVALWSQLRDLRAALRIDGSSQIESAEWTEAVRLADSGVRGILRDLAQFGLPVPEIGYEFADERGTVIAEAEAIWLEARVALVTGMQWENAGAIQTAGWLVQCFPAEPAIVGRAVCMRTPALQPPARSAEPPNPESDCVYALAAAFFRAAFQREPFSRAGRPAKNLGLNWDGVDRSRHAGIAAFLEKATHPSSEERYPSTEAALAGLALHTGSILRGRPQVDSGLVAADSPQHVSEGSESVQKSAGSSSVPVAPRYADSSDFGVTIPQGASNPSVSPALFERGRKMLAGWLRKQLIGPADEEAHLGMSPLDRYPVGVLHPIEPGVSGVDPAALSGQEEGSDALLDEPEATETSGEAGRAEASPARRRRYVPPSSVGFSFFVRGDARLTISARAAAYTSGTERDERGRFVRSRFVRNPIEESSLDWRVSQGNGRRPRTDPDGNEVFAIDARSRPALDGSICTVSLCNPQKIGPGSTGRSWGEERATRSLFEAELECVVESGDLAEFPRVDESLLSAEEQELALQYASRRILAVGHGGAVTWETGRDGKTRIRTDFLPKVEVPLVTTELADGPEEVLGFQFLAEAPGREAVPAMERFVAGYERWIGAQSIREMPERQRPVADRIRSRMHVAVGRMRRGIALLREDRIAADAFRFANQAMLDQMRQQNRVAGRNVPVERYRWRPFQLAFLLTVIESTVREDDDFRDVLDLIWFPTGGGKTEAYLGLIAFLIAWRRMSHRNAGGGTVVLMRYTLRLLTKQQFERATRIVFALELLRRADATRLGSEPITAGIWVGRSTSPNTFREAMALRQGIADGIDAPNGLMVAACPWCGTGFEAENYSASATHFSFRCRNPRCEFSASGDVLPCNVVDEALYRQPPTVLIGTVDKFARLAWEERAGAFFGRAPTRPPELVIQDELHLITGPLGSVAGLYEAALDTIVQTRGVRPKYIASTATIRKAADQVRGLYGRGLAVFPPPGLSCDDCYFARSDRSRPGRLYVGYFAPMLDQRHCFAPLAAALLRAPLEVFRDQPDREDLLEGWWTQLIYHSNLVDVGNSHNAYAVDVREWTERLAQEAAASPADSETGDSAEAGEPPGTAETPERALQPEIAQLTSIASAKENSKTFDRLALARGEEGCLDVVLATNMVSVGVDVARLAVMVVNGQPLTTTEYIQASSRVGRSDVPGLVIANYFRHQARSLSHYEIFRPYHESFYRFVEAASVTPFTLPVRSRALHAALVIALRHTCGALRRNRSAREIDLDDREVRRTVAILKRRLGSAAADGQLARTLQHVDELLHYWRDHARHCRDSRRALLYHAGDRGSDSLLHGHDDRVNGLWSTLHSMRNVESTGVLKET